MSEGKDNKFSLTILFFYLLLSDKSILIATFLKTFETHDIIL